MVIERRVRRSEWVSRAVNLQLAACLDRYGLPSIVVGDDRGMLVGSARELSEIDEAVLAFAPLLCRTDARADRVELADRMRRDVPPQSQRQLSVRRFRIGGEPLYLCAIGERTRAKEAAMVHAITGLKRILER